jgi:Uncharacterised nucleotidyltransferase
VSVLSPWPGTDELLLLCAALLDDRRAVEAWRRLGGAEDFIERLNRNAHWVLPQLYRNLLSLGVESPSMGRLKGVYRHAWYSNQRLLHDAAPVLGALRDAGLEPMVLNGAALVALYARDLGVRPIDTVEIVVPRDQTPRAAAILAASGLGSIGPRGWAVLAPGTDPEVRAQATIAVLAGVPTLVPCATDQLLRACTGGRWLSPGTTTWIVDALLVLRAEDHRIDWDRLVRRARAGRVRLAAADALRFLEREFTIGLPEGVTEELRRDAGARERVRNHLSCRWRATRRLKGVARR